MAKNLRTAKPKRVPAWVSVYQRNQDRETLNKRTAQERQRKAIAKSIGARKAAEEEARAAELRAHQARVQAIFDAERAAQSLAAALDSPHNGR